MNHNSQIDDADRMNETIESQEAASSVAGASAASVSFRERFWGERANGYEVLLQNMRNSQTAVKEFVQFLRESAAAEEQYVKQLNRVGAQFQKFLVDSSMAPVWLNVLKELNEHNAWAHAHLSHGLQERAKAAQAYGKALRKRKHQIKESELRTQEAVERYRLTRAQLAKAKDQYHLVSFELDKQQQLLRLNQQQSSASPATLSSLAASIQKLERKKLASLDEYRSLIERFNAARADYVKRLEASSDVFQTQEEEHLVQMRTFVRGYMELVSRLNATGHKDFARYSDKFASVFSNEFLLAELVRVKALGDERPAPAEFVEASALTGKALKNGAAGEPTAALSMLNLARGGNYGSRRSLTSPIKFSGAGGGGGSCDDLSEASSQLFNSHHTSSSLNSKSGGGGGAHMHQQQSQLSVSLPRPSVHQAPGNESLSMIGPGYSVIADVSSADMNLSSVSVGAGSNSVHYTSSNSNSQLLLESKRSTGLQGLINMDFLGRKSKKDSAASAGATNGNGLQFSSTPKKGANKLTKFATFDADSVRSESRRSKKTDDSLSASSITDRVEATFDEPILELNQLEQEANSKKLLRSEKRASQQPQETGSDNSKSTRSSERSSLGGLTKKLFSSSSSKQPGEPAVNMKLASPLNTKMAFIDSLNSQIDDEDDFFPAFDDIDLSVRNKTNSDMNNLYEESESSGDERKTATATAASEAKTQRPVVDSSSDSDSDSDSSDDSDAPMKVMLRIKPKSEMTERDQVASPDVLRMISKNLILNSPSDKMLSSRSRSQTTSPVGPLLSSASSSSAHQDLTNNNGVHGRLPRPQIPPRPRDLTSEMTSSMSSASFSLSSQLATTATANSTALMSGSLYSPSSIMEAGRATSTSPSLASNTSRSASAVSFLYGTHDLLSSPTQQQQSPASPPPPPLPPLPAHIQERFSEKQRLYMQRQQLTASPAPAESPTNAPSGATPTKRASLETTAPPSEPGAEPVAKYTTQISSLSTSSLKRGSRIELRRLNLNLAPDENVVTEL